MVYQPMTKWNQYDEISRSLHYEAVIISISVTLKQYLCSIAIDHYRYMTLLQSIHSKHWFSKFCQYRRFHAKISSTVHKTRYILVYSSHDRLTVSQINLPLKFSYSYLCLFPIISHQFLPETWSHIFSLFNWQSWMSQSNTVIFRVILKILIIIWP